MAGLPYYNIVPCCPSQGTQMDYFNFPTGDSISSSGVYVYNGLLTTINGITFTPGQCYTITQVGTIFNIFPEAPGGSQFSIAANCIDANICEPCEKQLQCYTLYPCSPDLPILVTDSTTAEDYINQFVSLFGYPGCYYVQPNAPGNCANAENIVINGELPCTCVLNCYTITGNPTSVIYVDANMDLVTTSGSVTICSHIVPVVSGGLPGVIYNFGQCINNTCPEVCFKFTNCKTLETLIVSNTSNVVGYYADNKVVVIQGYEGCWTIEISDEPCDCAVNVTILQAYDDCITCLPIIAYKFTNCDNQSIIKYSTDDYSAYVGKTVKLDCGDCWFVDLINYTPPATQVINIITTFESCIACSRQYYVLKDCSLVEPDLYTYTDLSNEVGKVVKIDSCNTCWTVEELPIPTSDKALASESVTLVVSYDTCEGCNIEIKCQCSTAWPTETGLLSYIDCNGNAYAMRGLDPNVAIDKICIRKWIIAREPIYHGDCISSESTFCNTYNIIIPALSQQETLFYKDCNGVVQENVFPISNAPVEYVICGIANQTVQDIYITGFVPVRFTVGPICSELPLYECPPPVLPKRFIKPGYFVPSCDTEKYEKFACKSSEILYKTVLEKRYGISNCCPDTDMGERWLVKKELADLQGALDPNYICTPSTSCCNNTPTCGCGCNSAPKTCKS